MQASVVALGLILTVGAVAASWGDYRSFVSESPGAVALSSFYLLDDNATTADVRLRLTKIGYPAADKVFAPALRRDPASSVHWIDEAEVFLTRGDKDRSRYCYEEAVKLAPRDPVTLFAVADFYASADDAVQSVALFSRILDIESNSHSDDRILIENIFGYYDRLQVRRRNLINEAIPNAASGNGWLTYLIRRADPTAVREVFQWMQAKNWNTDEGTAAYAQFMFGKQQYEAATEGWDKHFAGRKDGLPAINPVFNSGFEYEPVKAELDWNFRGAQGVTVERDPTQHHDGRYSLRMDFTANDNPDFHDYYQVVALAPGRYRLAGFLRTLAVTSAEGLRLRVAGYGNASIFGETEALTGTNEWTALGTNFDVPSTPGARTTLVQIQLARRRALRIDNQLTGRIWLDSVSLTRLP